MAFVLVAFSVLFAAVLYFVCSRKKLVNKMEPWKNSGWLKGEGIPAPRGRYEVGCVDLMHRLEGDSDGLLVRLFYPTDPGLAGRYPYSKATPHPRYIKATLQFLQLKWSGLIAAIITPFSDNRCPALYAAPLLNADSHHPLLVFTHGVGGMRSAYMALCCELASHGYVIASVEHSDRSACIALRKTPKPGAPGEYEDKWLTMTYPGGRLSVKSKRQLPERREQLSHRVKEVGKALDLLQLLNEGGEVTNMMGERFDWGQFRGRLQLDTAAVMGHSFGGATTIQTLYTDKRFKCGIAIDAWMLPILDDELDQPLEQPLLLINCSFGFQWPEAIRKMMKIVKPPDDQGLMSTQILTIKGSDHILSCDGHFLADFSLIPGINWRPKIKALTAHQVLADVCCSFLGRFLLKEPAYQQRVPSLDGGEGASEHILFGTNVDWK